MERQRGRNRWRKEEGRGRGGGRRVFADSPRKPAAKSGMNEEVTQCNVRREIPLSAPQYRQPPFAPCLALLPARNPSTFEPFTSNGKKREGGRGRKRGQTRGREEEKKQVDLKRALMRGQRLGGELSPSFFHCIGIKVV